MLKLACPYHLLTWQKMFPPVFFSRFFVFCFLFCFFFFFKVLSLSILLSLKQFPYCWFIFHIKCIFLHLAPGVTTGKTDGFSWYAVRVTWPESVKKLENAGIKHLNNPDVFIESSNTMDDVYENINDYNLIRKRKK